MLILCRLVLILVQSRDIVGRIQIEEAHRLQRTGQLLYWHYREVYYGRLSGLVLCINEGKEKKNQAYLEAS